MNHSKKRFLSPFQTLCAATLLTIGMAWPCAAQNTTELSRTVKSVGETPCMAHASLSLCVYNITHSRTVYAYNEHLSLLPASMAKVFTTAIAFDQLGPDFRFKTTLSHTGTIDAAGVLHGDLYIIGGGDPLLGSYRYRQTTPDTLFATWCAALRKAGIKRIEGRVCYNQAIFDNTPLHDSWQWGDIGNYYATGACGLNFHENMYFAYFDAGKRLGHPATLTHTLPRNINISIVNEVATGPEKSGDNVVIYGDPSSTKRLHSGTVPLGAKQFAVRGSLPSPAAACAELFASYLRDQGINISSSVKETPSLPKGLNTLLDYYSSPYKQLAQYINHTSNNMYAECVFKYLGYHRYGKGSFANGRKALNDFMASHSLDMGGVRLYDGSGLSRDDNVTADFTCRFLNEVSGMLIYDEFLQTMSQAGKTGTARSLLPALPAGVTMQVKSGTMSGVKAFCGYVTTASGEQLCFCLMANQYEGSATEATKHLEKLLAQIAALR